MEQTQTDAGVKAGTTTFEDESPLADVPGATVEHSGDNYREARHTDGDLDKWFDLISFGSAGRFKRFLASIGADPEPEPTKVAMSAYNWETLRYRYEWVWVGDGVVVSTGANPLTGELGAPRTTSNHEGFASAVSIHGRREDVFDAVGQLGEYAVEMKGCEQLLQSTTVRASGQDVTVDLPLDVEVDRGVRITTADGYEVARWTPDEYGNPDVADAIVSAVDLAVTDPVALCDQQAAHIVAHYQGQQRDQDGSQDGGRQ